MLQYSHSYFCLGFLRRVGGGLDCVLAGKIDVRDPPERPGPPDAWSYILLRRCLHQTHSRSSSLYDRRTLGRRWLASLVEGRHLDFQRDACSGEGKREEIPRHKARFRSISMFGRSNRKYFSWFDLLAGRMSAGHCDGGKNARHARGLSSDEILIKSL